MSAGGGVVYRPAGKFRSRAKGKRHPHAGSPGRAHRHRDEPDDDWEHDECGLRGQIHLYELSFTPDFDLNELMGSFGGTASAPPSQGFSNDLQLGLIVNSPNGINLVSRDLSLQGNATLQVRGTAAEPVVLGRVNVNSGDLLFRGNCYLLQSGTIAFRQSGARRSDAERRHQHDDPTI